jgi:lipoprotein NlpI
MHEYDQAIASYNRSIDIVSKNAVAFFHRGQAYEAKKDHDNAMADYDHAIRLSHKYPDALYRRALLYEHNQSYERAIADFDEALGLGLADGLIDRGFCHYQLGQMTDAESDFAKAQDLNPKDPYAVLWLYLARVKAGQSATSELAMQSVNLDLTKWPGQIIQLYLGRMTEAQVLAAIPADDTGKQSEQACAMPFYIGQYYGLHGDKAGAETKIGKVVNDCLYVGSDRSASAKAELVWLQIRLPHDVRGAP